MPLGGAFLAKAFLALPFVVARALIVTKAQSFADLVVAARNGFAQLVIGADITST